MQTSYTWITSGDLQIGASFYLDPLSSVMILVVTGIGSLIHIYSTAYMHDETDSEFARYFCNLNLFAAFMLVLVLGANLPVMFVGWEGVGLCSYLLIGFWYQEEVGHRRRQQGVYRQPHRRLRVHPRHAAASSRSSARSTSRASPATVAHASGRDGLGRGVGRRAAAVHRRHRQVGADSALRLAAGRDGRSDAGLGADSRGDDGDRGRLHDWAERRSLQPCARGDAGGGGHRRGDGALCRNHRPRPERHQARAGVLDRVAARATCSWRWASARSGRVSSTCTRTRSSRRCCSSAPVR